MKRTFTLFAGILIIILAATNGRVRSAVAELLASDTEGTIVAPVSEGSGVVAWQGTVPAGGNGGGGGVDPSLCIDSADGNPLGNSWFYTLTLDGIAPDYYDTHNGKLDVRLDWDPASGEIATQDLELYILDSGGNLLGASETASNSEFVQLLDPAAGDYTLIACGYLVALEQVVNGMASFSVQETTGGGGGGDSSVPVAEVDHGYEYSPIIIVDPQRDVAEPSLRVAPDGIVYACGPYGASRAAEYAQRSLDDGDTFRVLGLPPEGRIATGGGGDCELSVGTELNENGQYTVAYTGLEALVNFSHSTTRDAGATWYGGSAAVTFAGVDRQWMEGTGVDTVYLGYNAIAAGYQVVRSDDGGETYAPDPPVTAVSDLFRPGPIRIDPNPDHNPEADNEVVFFTFSRSDGVWIARSYDRGLTWTEHEVASGFDPNILFTTIALDTDGNLYAAWAERGSFNTYYAYSLVPGDGSAAGDVWSEKRIVNRQPVFTTAMPWIEAGSPGNISISYYGTEFDGDPETGAFNAYWDVYVATSFNALDPIAANGSVPFDQTKATTHPVHWDSICMSGLGCNISVPEGDRTLLDFFQNRVGPDGRIHIVYDQSNKLPGETVGRIAIVSYSKQIAGPSLYDNMSIPVENRPNMTNQRTDMAGDSQFPISTFAPLVQPPSPVTNDVPALDILDLTLEAVEGGEVGEFEIVLTMDDLSTTALTEAVANMQSGSLLYVVRWFSGLESYAAVASYNGVWSFGFNELAFATATGSKLQAYTGATATLEGSVDGNIIRMKVPTSLLETIDLPATSGTYSDPVERPVVVGDVIRSVTAFTFGNVAASPLAQEYLNQADSTYPFDYRLTAIPTAVQLSGQGQAVAADQSAESVSFTLPPLPLLAGFILLVASIVAVIQLTWRRVDSS